MKHQHSSGYVLKKGGIEDFSWPITRGELVEKIRSLITTSVKFFKNSDTSNNKVFKNLEISNQYFLRKVLSIYNSKICFQRLEMSGGLPENSAIINELLRKTLETEDEYLIPFKYGFRKEVTRRAFIIEKLRNYLATLKRKDGFTRKNIEKIDINNEIVCTGVSPLSSRYLKSINRSGYQVRISEYFPKDKKLDLDHFLNNSDQYHSQEAFVEYKKSILDWLESQEVVLSAQESENCFLWLSNFLAYVDYYRVMLDNNLGHIPRILWTSSAGIVWNKLLAVKVLEQGGEVTVFDHAQGANFSLNTYTPFVEFQDTTYFVTFSSAFIKYLTKASEGLVYRDKLPVIFYPED